MTKNKSAKDIAFEKERLEIRKEAKIEIQDITTLLFKARSERDAALERAQAAETKNAELEEWVDRLLEYTNLSKGDMIAIGTAEGIKQENEKTMIHCITSMRQMKKLFEASRRNL